ncbi:MAG: DUF4157 domain-containing protein [Proteobacteria bacterium]|nr:DUF4157 domain-containing protein [Pseudomonadota bacterium]
MGKSIEKSKEKSSPVVSPARQTRQPVGLYSRYIQMKEDKIPLIQRRGASDHDMYVNPKMDVVDSEDASEKEADATADQVMSASESDMDEKKVQAKPLAGSISRKGRSGGSGVSVSGNTASYVDGLSGGQPLSRQEKSFHEPRFGADFSNVRVHNDSKAHEAAQSINAKAFTSGNNIVFGKGQYSPDSSSGKHLMAHELTHTVQQNVGSKIQRQANTQSSSSSPSYIGNLTLYGSGLVSKHVESIDVLYNYFLGRGGMTTTSEVDEHLSLWYFPVIENVNCIGYGIVEEDQEPTFSKKAFILNATRHQWETIKNFSHHPVIYDLLIYPFIQAAVGQFSYSGGTVPAQPLDQAIVKPFADAFFGIDYSYFDMQNYRQVSVDSSPMDLPEQHAFDDYKGNAVSEFISMYIPQMMGSEEYLTDEITELTKDMKGGIFGDDSVANDGKDAIRAMFHSAYITASKKIIESSFIDDADPFSSHSDLATEIRKAGQIMRGVSEGYNERIAEAKKGVETVAGLVWNLIPISSVTTRLPAGALIGELVGQAKVPIINAISTSFTKRLKDNDRLNNSRGEIMNEFRNELVAQYENEYGGQTSGQITITAEHSRRLENAIGWLEDEFR